MAKYILFDTETTGANEEDRIIQVGAMIVDSSGDIEVYNQLCSSQVSIKLEAMEVHGITPELIQNKPKLIDTRFYKRFEELNNSDNFLIAHNLPFDLNMIEKEGFKNSYNLIDTLRCSRHLLSQMPSHRLQYLRYALELYKEENNEAKKHNIAIKAHDAIGDVLVMKLLLSKLVAISKEQFSKENPILKLQELTKQPIFVKTFKFGKYKDQNIEDIFKKDIGYIKWIMENTQLDEDMRYTLDVIGKK